MICVGTSGVNLVDKINAGGCSFAGENVERFLDATTDPEALLLKHYFSGFDLGEVDYTVDDAEEVSPQLRMV